MPSVRLPVLRAVALGAGRRALQVAGPGYLALLIASLVVFGGNGLHPATIVAWAARFPLGGLALYAAWCALSGRAYRAAVTDASWPMLRSLPLGRWPLAGSAAVLACAIELPWLVFWGFGAGLLEAVVAAAVSVGASTAWLPLPQLARFRILSALLIASAAFAPCIAPPTLGGRLVSHCLLLATVAVSLYFTVGQVWRRFLERFAPARQREPLRSPLVALTLAHIRTLGRSHAFALLGSAAFTAVAALVVSLMFERKHEAPSAQVTFGVSVLASSSALSATLLRWLLLRHEAANAWVVHASPVGTALRGGAPLVAITLWIACGSLMCATLVWLRASLTLPALFEFAWRGVWIASAVGAVAATVLPLTTSGGASGRSLTTAAIGSAVFGVWLAQGSTPTILVYGATAWTLVSVTVFGWVPSGGRG